MNTGASFLEPESWIDYFGKRYEDTMLDSVTGEYYTLETYKATVASEPTRPIVIFKMPAEDQAKWLTLKGVTMASDTGLKFMQEFGRIQTGMVADPVLARSQAALRADLGRGVECRILDRYAYAN